MTGSADLVVWLRAQLDEDERLAHEALRENPLYIPMCLHVPPEVAMHNAHHHPARVLVEVESKRRILDDAEGVIIGFTSEDAKELARDTIKLLALPYADRPGYREEWRP